MVSVDHATIARFSKGSDNFEILVDPDLALRFRKGEPISIENILAIPEIFSDARKGERVKGESLKKVFGSHDVLSICTEIIKHGEIQLTTEQRRKLTEEKRREIATTISRQGMDPKTKLPHPPQRILNAMEQAKVNIDPFRPAREQVNDVLTKIQPIIPISLERIEVAIRVPIEHAGRASSEIRKLAPVKSEEWRNDAWIALIEIPAGMQADIYDSLNKITAGRVEVKIVKEYKI
jgi:ribosome maturation protein SDO1